MVLFPPIASRYIPAGFQERAYTTPCGKGTAIVYWKQYQNSENKTRFHAMGYRGRSNKPAWNYVFRTVENMENYISEFFNSVKKHEDLKNQEKERRKNFVPSIKTGDILETCWGYDQTNVEYFQVIGIKNKTVVLREIGQKEVAGTGPYSGTVTALKDHFIGKEISRRVAPGNSVRIDQCRTGFLWDGKPSYCSWGA